MKIIYYSKAHFILKYINRIDNDITEGEKPH